MIHCRALLLALLLICVGQACAGLAEPECADIAAWSKGFDAQATYAVAPAVELPEAVGGEGFRSLFGKSVSQWSADDFRSFDRQMKQCQGALFKADRDLATRMNEVRKQFRGIARSVQDLSRAGAQAADAVGALAAMPDTPELADALSAADAALAGEDVGTQAGRLPRQAAAALRQLASVQPGLAAADARDLSARLDQRGARLQAALESQRRAEEQAQARARERAAEELEAARQELKAASAALEALPVTAESLPELERLAALPALGRVTEAEAGSFRQALQAKRDAVGVIVERERRAQAAQDITQRVESLRSFDVDGLEDLGTYWQMITDLGALSTDPANAAALSAGGFDQGEMQTFRERFDQSAARLLPRFEARLKAVPETAAGLERLRTVVTDTTGMRVRHPAMQAYHRSVQQRARAVEAAVRHAAEWFAVTPRLEILLQGDDLDDLTLRGLRPGMDRDDALAAVKGEWGFDARPSLDLKKTYGPGQGAARRLKEERRDGGALILEEMQDDLGQVGFLEHYKAGLELDLVHDWLVQRFGRPQDTQPSDHGVVWTWRDGDRRLQVMADNQVDVIMYGADYRSKLGIALWNEDYEDYLVDATERCDRIRGMPRNEWSMDDAAFFMKVGCPLVGRQPLEAGL